jgi:hypothetical protein
MPLRAQLERTEIPTEIDTSDESYFNGVQVLAKLMLEELDKKPDGWEPQSDSASELGDELYPVVKEKIPACLKGQFSGNQVMTAAHVAYRAYKGD